VLRRNTFSRRRNAHIHDERAPMKRTEFVSGIVDVIAYTLYTINIRNNRLQTALFRHYTIVGIWTKIVSPDTDSSPLFL